MAAPQRLLAFGAILFLQVSLIAATTCVCDVSGYHRGNPYGGGSEHLKESIVQLCQRVDDLEGRLEDTEHRLEDATHPPEEDEPGQIHHATHPAVCDIECHGEHASWGYTPTNGDRCWNRCVPACGGSSQSPINLRTAASVSHTFSEPRAKTEGYYTQRHGKLVNNGHSVTVSLDDHDAPMAVSGLGLPGKYEAAQFHFHWGDDSSRGSEHTINGRQYPMEMHIVHYHTQYENIGEAVDKPKGLAVLGFMFYVSPEENHHFDDIISKLSSVTNPHDEVDLEPFTMSELLPGFPSDYYRYSGSLTTPPCHESVVWTVFTKPISISESQLAQFRKLSAGDHGHGAERLTDNFRHTLPQGDRTVIYSSM